MKRISKSHRGVLLNSHDIRYIQRNCVIDLIVNDCWNYAHFGQICTMNTIWGCCLNKDIWTCYSILLVYLVKYNLDKNQSMRLYNHFFLHLKKTFCTCHCFFHCYAVLAAPHQQIFVLYL